MNFSNRRAGAIIPLLALVVTAMLAIAALTINSNWMLFSQINVQNSADLSARSALVKVIADTEFDGRIDRARSLGGRLYDLNIDRPNHPGFDANEIRFGSVADRAALEPTFVATNSNNFPISAVHVGAPVAQDQREINVFLSTFLGGRQTVDVAADALASTRPLDLVLCLDASRSMNRTSSLGDFPPGGSSIHEVPLPGSRWFEVTDTVELFLESMQAVNPNARVALVTFGGGAGDSRVAKTGVASALDADHARLEQPLTIVISPQANAINQTLQSYVDDNPALGLGTSLFDGLEFSLAALNDPNASRHVIMLSDGNQAAVTRPDPLTVATTAQQNGVTVHTISFGGNINVMENIANETGGENFTALSEEELRQAFADLLGRFRTQLVD